MTPADGGAAGVSLDPWRFCALGNYKQWSEAAVEAARRVMLAERAK